MVRKNGYLIVTEYKELEKYIKGRKEKKWIEIAGKTYLFKTGSINYETLAELISSEIIKQCGYEAAEYDVAYVGGQFGLLSPNFLKEGETIISGDNLLEFYRKVLLENDKPIGNLNSIQSIIGALKYFSNNKIKEDEIFEKLAFLWCFDNLFLESDRNPTNWSIIENGINGEYRFAPIYDSSTICRFNNNIKDIVDRLRFSGDVNYLFKDINPQLKFYENEENNHFFETFKKFVSTYPKTAEKIMKALNKINIEKAIKDIEEKLNTNSNKEVRIPWEAQYIIDKVVINYRLPIMNEIWEKSLENENLYTK